MNLEGRTAKCTSCGKERPSSTELAFFTFRGEGSREATESCKCGFFEVAHQYDATRVYPEPVDCPHGGFVAKGPQETDTFYCGCRGFD